MPDLRAPKCERDWRKAAFELFARRGINNVNLDEVAAHAGVTKGSLYWHYKSKKEVVLAACAYYYRRWQQRAHAEIALDNDPLGQLERVLRFSVQSCLFDRANRVFTTEIMALLPQDNDIRAVGPSSTIRCGSFTWGSCRPLAPRAKSRWPIPAGPSIGCWQPSKGLSSGRPSSPKFARPTNARPWSRVCSVLLPKQPAQPGVRASG